MASQELSERTILTVDNFLHPKVFSALSEEVLQLQNWEPEIDRFDKREPTGESCNLGSENKMYHAILEELAKMFSRPLDVDRMYVNRFKPGEVPRFHQDGDVLTCLLYADPYEWSIDEYGETQMFVNDELRGILPIPNRMVIFDGRLAHRATSFATRVRHTVATKLQNMSFSDIVWS
jgi:hypothetical protein